MLTGAGKIQDHKMVYEDSPDDDTLLLNEDEKRAFLVQGSVSGRVIREG